MSKTVIILGAGASAQAGAPLMKDFLDRAEKVKPGDGYRNPDEAKRAFQLVFKALDPCPDDSVENRFRALLGPETEDRFKIHPRDV